MRPNSRRTGDGVRIYAHGATESVGVIAGRLSFSRACVRVSIFWGDSVCQVRNLTYGGHGLIAF